MQAHAMNPKKSAPMTPTLISSLWAMFLELVRCMTSTETRHTVRKLSVSMESADILFRAGKNTEEGCTAPPWLALDFPWNFVPQMIIGLLVTNTETNQAVARAAHPLSQGKLEHFVTEFNSTASPSCREISRGMYKYTYVYDSPLYYALISTPEYPAAKTRRIIETLQKNTTGDVADILVTIDNILYGQALFAPNLGLIKSMESQEEKIYELMMKNKTKELVQRQKELQRKAAPGAEPVRMPSFQAVSEPVAEAPKAKANPVKEKRMEFLITSKPVLVILREKLRMVVDKENNIKSSEVQGDMSLMVKDEGYKNLEIRVKNVTEEMRLSPNLDKSMAARGILRYERGFTVEQNVALIKWRSSGVERAPITFTYWPSETGRDAYQIMLECTAEHDLNSLNIFIPKKKLSNVTISGAAAEKDAYIEWAIGDVPRGSSDTLEFSCTCSDPAEVFPLDVYFTSDFVLSGLEVQEITSNGEPVEEVEIKRMFEVDKFTVVDE
jgi:coatomer subunit delta